MRIALTAGVLTVWLLGVWAMWRGWRRRITSTALPPLPTMPELPGADVAPPLVGVYLGTTYAGSWLDRVAGARLGERSTGWLRVLPAGVLIRRPGYDDLFVPAAALFSARTDSAHAGKVIGAEGVLIIEWRHGDTALETGFRGDDRSRHAAITEAVARLIPSVLHEHLRHRDESLKSVKESS
ncbi:MAG: transporter [Mycobacteriales bacterium]